MLFAIGADVGNFGRIHAKEQMRVLMQIMHISGNVIAGDMCRCARRGAGCI